MAAKDRKRPAEGTTDPPHEIIDDFAREVVIEPDYERGSIEWRIYRMAKVCVPIQDVAYILGIEPNAVAHHYNHVYEAGRALARTRLRRKQWSVALEGGDKTMLIWLGKQELGQTDKVETASRTETTMTVNLVEATEDAAAVPSAEVIAIGSGS